MTNELLGGCTGCGNPVIENWDLYLCASCAHRHRKEARQAARPQPTYQMPSRKPINPVSEKMAAKLVTFEQKKKVHLQAHPDCQARLTQCTNHNNTVHHTAKRGKNLNNEETFLTVCQDCHNQIEFVMSAKERRERGFLK